MCGSRLRQVSKRATLLERSPEFGDKLGAVILQLSNFQVFVFANGLQEQKTLGDEL